VPPAGQKDQRETRGKGGKNNPQGLGGKSKKEANDIVNHDNVTIDNIHETTASQGNSRQYALRRLRKATERDPATYQATYQKVLNGEIKPHTALKLVGLVKVASCFSTRWGLLLSSTLSKMAHIPHLKRFK